jgi:hypothetical protein
MSRQNKLAPAMLSLLANPAFDELINEIDQMKDAAVRDLVNDAVVGDNNKVMAAIGEVRSYLSILDLYQGFADNPQNVVDEKIPE